MNITKLINEANEAFISKHYDFAMLHFADALKLDPSNKEAKIGVILTELAMDGEESAVALFDYYEILKNSETDNPESIVEKLVESLEHSYDNLEELIASVISDKLEDNGINYDDFKEFVKTRGSFKRAFEDIMFSTRVIISSKEDFIEFLNQLIESEFTEMAFNYIESAIVSHPTDKQLLALFDKIQEMVQHWDYNYQIQAIDI